VTATELTYFTVTGFYYDVESPYTGSTTNADQFNGLTGAFITFTPRVPAGFTVLISNLDLGSGNTGSTSISLPPITGRVLSTTAMNDASVWQLATINTADSPGIQLLANSTPISTYLSAQGIQGGALIYDVSFTRVTFAGDNQTIQNFAFTAPTSNTTICITDPTLTRLPYQAP
jgi:hypothetical protein